MTRIAFIAALASAVNAAAWTAAPTACKDAYTGLNKSENNCSFYGCAKKDIAELAKDAELSKKCGDALAICVSALGVVTSTCKKDDCDAF